MAITGNSTYIPTMNDFAAHWAQSNEELGGNPLLVRLPDDTTRTEAEFLQLRAALQTRQNGVQACLAAQQLARSNIFFRKETLLGQLNEFISLLDAYFQRTDFYSFRPYSPSINDGQEAFTGPLVDMMVLWELINDGPAPTGVTLPLVLEDGLDLGTFASAVSSLQFAYANERRKVRDVAVARSQRNDIQSQAYEIMKYYRDAALYRLRAYPALIETLPRLTPLPGHTPEAVNASAIFQAPNSSRVVYDASSEATLERYELRGTVGDHYDEEDAVVIASHSPEDPREFITPFGLNQPGAEIALKVFVILTTGNEAGSAPMLVERPVNVQLLAA